MAAVRQKLKRLGAAIQKVDEFAAAGGDLKSQAAAPVWMDLLGGFASIAREFGYELGKPVKKEIIAKPGQASET